LNKESVPVPYAFILINGKPVTITDTLGIGMIPVNILKNNDTIGISYLGAKTESKIFNQSLREGKKLSFYIDESGFNLNEVIVTYQDNEKLFRKAVKEIPALNYNCQMDAEFDAKLIYPDKSVYSVSGAFEAANGLRHTAEYLNWDAPPLKIFSSSDTAVIGRYLDPEIRVVFFNIYQSLSIWQYKGKLIKKPYYNYLGEKENLRVFRISYPPGYISNFYLQIVLYVDKSSKYIHSVEIEAFEASGNDNRLRFSLKFDCNVFSNKNTKLNRIYLPDNIKFRYQNIDKLQFDLNIRNISVK
jgi:hypothetical protein